MKLSLANTNGHLLGAYFIHNIPNKCTTNNDRKDIQHFRKMNFSPLLLNFDYSILIKSLVVCIFHRLS